MRPSRGQVHHQFGKCIFFLAFGYAHGLVAHARCEQGQAFILAVGANDVNRDMHRLMGRENLSLRQRINRSEYLGHARNKLIVNPVGNCGFINLFRLPYRLIDPLDR